MEAILLACAANVQVGGRGHPARSTTVSKGWTRTSDKCGGYSGYSGDIAVDNVSSPKPRTCGGYSEDAQIRACDNQRKKSFVKRDQ